MIKICSLAFISLLTLTPVTLASDVLTLTEAQTSGSQGNLPRIQVWPGSGVNISFRESNEKIRKVWLDDPSRLTLDGDFPLDSGLAQFLHLRRINSINFPALPQTATTLLTVITDQGRHQFIISYGQGTPQYYGVIVREASSPATMTALMPIDWAINVRRGLQEAQAQNLISQQQGNLSLLPKVYQVLALVRQGRSLSNACRQVGLSEAFISKLEEMGRFTEVIEENESGDLSWSNLLFEPF